VTKALDAGASADVFGAFVSHRLPKSASSGALFDLAPAADGRKAS
jgi:hypothetical protein